MSYNPGVVDISGQLRAQGMLQAGQQFGQTADSLTQNLAQFQQKQEAQKQAMAAVKGTAQFLKTNAQLLGVDENTVADLTTQQPNESPLQWQSRMGAFLAQTMQKPILQEAQAKIAQANAQTANLAQDTAKTKQLLAQQGRDTAAIVQGLEPFVKPGSNGEKLPFDPTVFLQTAAKSGLSPQGMQGISQFLDTMMKTQSNEEVQAARAEASAAKANQLKIPEGYRPTAQGNLEPIPGGPASFSQGQIAGKQQVLKEKADKEKQAAIDSADQTIQDLNEAIDMAQKHSVKTGGVLGAVGGAVPGTDAYTFAKKLDTVKANIAIGTLQQMRALSQSGASGFGQLSAKELDVLQSKLGNLSTGLAHDDLVKNMKDVQKSIKKMRDSVASASGPTFEERLAAYDNK